MSRGLRSAFEGAALVLALAVVILVAGVGYGLYAQQSAPALVDAPPHAGAVAPSMQ